MMQPFSNFIIFISLILLPIFGCTKIQEKTTPDQPKPVPVADPAYPSQSITYLALGDSYTIGHGVDEDQRFPQQTADLLKKNNIITDKLQYVATNGWTAFNLQGAIQRAQLDSSYTIVTLLIGVNDQYQGNDIRDYTTRFTDLLKNSISLAGNDPSQVFVLSIPDYSVTPFVPTTSKEKVSNEIDQFNRVNYSITLDFKCHYIDVTSISRQAGGDASMLAADGLHPSAKQYRLWALDLAEAITKQLK